MFNVGVLSNFEHGTLNYLRNLLNNGETSLFTTNILTYFNPEFSILKCQQYHRKSILSLLAGV